MNLSDAGAKLEDELPTFAIEDFDPSDTAPPGDPRHDCTGEDDDGTS